MSEPLYHDVDQTYGTSVAINLAPGTAWAIYADNGPGGICGQSMRITCPHTVLMTFPDEATMRAKVESQPGRNKKHTLMFGVVDEYTAGGIFRVVQYNESEASE